MLLSHFILKRSRPLILCLLILIWAALGQANELQSSTQGPAVRTQVAKIVLSSLGGTILGISTLSFYDRPQDHLSNVALGGTVGALLGSIYVTQESLDYSKGLEQENEPQSLEEGGSFYVSGTPETFQLHWAVLF